MTNGIGGVSGYGNYGVGGYMPQKRNTDAAAKDAGHNQVPENDYNETQLDPAKIMDFLANNNYFVQNKGVTEVNNVDAATQERVAGYMEQFEMIYALVVKEFGEELAPAVMDVVMNKLMGMTK